MSKKVRTRKNVSKSEDNLLAQAMEIQRQCEEAWLRDFGDRSVLDYETGQNLGTAKEVLKKHRQRTS